MISRLLTVTVQGEEFDEDEGIYDELNLDEEEEKFGLANDEHESDDSEDLSEGKSRWPTHRDVPDWLQTSLLEHRRRSRTMMKAWRVVNATEVLS